MKGKAIFILLLFCLCGGVIARVSQTSQQGDADQLTLQEAMGIVRTINTVQATLFSKTGAYVSLEKLAQDPTLQRRPIVSSLTDATTGTLKTHTLSVIASADGRHYSVALVPQSGCAFALFSRDVAIIYPAKPLGCVDR